MYLLDIVLTAYNGLDIKYSKRFIFLIHAERLTACDVLELYIVWAFLIT